MEDDLIPLGQAAEEFEINRVKLWRWIRAGRLVAHQSGRDLRTKLVRRSEVRALLEPTPLAVEATKKLAA